MKLVEIKDVRPGQIWKHNKTGLIHTVDDISDLRPHIPYDIIARRDAYLKECRLIGFLGITHEIEDEQLVEIPRAEFEVDDILEFGSNTRIGIAIITKNIDGIRYDIIKTDNSEVYYNLCRVYLNEKRTKILGIYGVTHEFINERLAK